jgi:hypothetical protein
MKNRLVVIAMLVLASVLRAQVQPEDHPMIGRFPGSNLVDRKIAQFDEYELALGPIQDTDKFVKAQHLEGKVTRLRYDVPEDRSSLEIERTYEAALVRSGFQVLFSCSGNGCFAAGFHYGYTNGSWGTWCTNCDEPMRFLAAKLSQPSGDVYVSLVVLKDHYEGGTWLSVVEMNPLGASMQTNPSETAGKMAVTDHASPAGATSSAVIQILRRSAIPRLTKLGN